jgi:hypothetical protein
MSDLLCESLITLKLNTVFFLFSVSSVAYPGYLSRIGRFRILIFVLESRISDPGSQNSKKREGWKKFVVTNITKLKIILFLN